MTAALPRDEPGRMVLITAGSIAAGLIGAISLVLGPASGASEPLVTGSVMLAFGAGWAMLALLSARFTSQPQQWALAPAAFLGVTGLALVVLNPGPAMMDLLSWAWPPVLLGVLAWTLFAMRRSLAGRARWLVMSLLAALAASAVAGGTATVLDGVSQATDDPSGSMVDIGGRRLYLECVGSGSPTVVLQSGLDEASNYWSRIATSVSTTARVCSYDRAGHGRSDPAGEQDGLAVARDLHALLGAANIDGPCVLVGHSTGGPYARVFAAEYPEQVAGVVFIDAQPVSAFTALPEFDGFYRIVRVSSAVLPSLARVGLGPLMGVTPRSATAARDEFAVLPTTLAQAAQLTTLGNRPVVVVTRATELQAGWTAAQNEMLGLSTNASHRTPEGSTHTSLIDDAEDSQATTQAILDAVEAVRSARPVAGL